MQITEISSQEYAAGIINSIADKEGAFRQRSKAPTFRPFLPRHIPHPNE